MSKHTTKKRRKEWEKGCEADGGNEDELMSCWQTLFTLSGGMTEGRSYRKKKKQSPLKSTADECFLCRLLIWFGSKFARSRPTWEEHARTSQESRALQTEERGAQEGKSNFLGKARTTPSPHPIPPSHFPPLPKNSITLYPNTHTHWTNYKHCLAAKSWGPLRVIACTGVCVWSIGEGKKAGTVCHGRDCVHSCPCAFAKQGQMEQTVSKARRTSHAKHCR